MPQLAKIPPQRQLQPIDLVAPGFRGLNTVQANTILSPAYATKAENAILDANGRLAARDGLTNLTTTAISPAVAVKTIFEQYGAAGALTTIIAYNGGISTSVTNPQGSDISGAVTDAEGRWRFQNFNDKVLGFQEGLKLIVRTTGNFATVVESSGTAPTGEVALCAFGRVWQVASDGTTLRWSGLLNETDWGSADSGSADFMNVWTDGSDTIMALAAFNGALVVFGRKHVIFLVDGQGSALGLDPTQMYVSDIIAGTGCISQYSVQHIGETDLLFLSPNGVQSLSRLIQERSNPMHNISKYVRDELLTQLQTQVATDAKMIRSTYNPLHGFYLLSLPTSGYVWVFDQRQRYQDADGTLLSVVTRWPLTLTAMYSMQDHDLLAARTTGKVAQYTGDTDEGTSYRFIYQSPWLDLGEDLANRLKFLKRMGSVLFVRTTTNVTFKWSVDFSDDFDQVIKTIEGSAAAEWNIGEWGLDEWSGGLAQRILKIPARKRGQYFRIGIEADVLGELAVQQAELFAKIGRLA